MHINALCSDFLLYLCPRIKKNQSDETLFKKYSWYAAGTVVVSGKSSFHRACALVQWIYLNIHFLPVIFLSDSLYP